MSTTASNTLSTLAPAATALVVGAAGTDRSSTALKKPAAAKEFGGSRTASLSVDETAGASEFLYDAAALAAATDQLVATFLLGTNPGSGSWVCVSILDTIQPIVRAVQHTFDPRTLPAFRIVYSSVMLHHALPTLYHEAEMEVEQVEATETKTFGAAESIPTSPSPANNNNNNNNNTTNTTVVAAGATPSGPTIAINWVDKSVHALGAVATTGDLKGLTTLTSRHKQDVDMRSPAGATAAMFAAAAGSGSALKHLITLGADLNLCDVGGWTALDHACSTGEEACVAILLEDIKSDNSRKEKMLAGMAQTGRRTVAHLAAEGGHTGVLQQLKDAGFDMVLQDGLGVTPLTLSAFRGDVRAVGFLHGECGADLDATSGQEGTTAAHEAAFMGHLPILRFLHDNGADMDQEDMANITPLMRATLSRRHGVVRFLRQECGCTLSVAAQAIVDEELADSDSESDDDSASG